MALIIGGKGPLLKPIPFSNLKRNSAVAAICCARPPPSGVRPATYLACPVRGGGPKGRSGQARQIVCELDQLHVLDRLQHLGHRRLVAVPGAALVLAQRLQQVILALTGQPRDIFLPGKIRAVADIAVVLLDERAGSLETRRVDGVGGPLWRRKRGDEIRRV